QDEQEHHHHAEVEQQGELEHRPGLDPLHHHPGLPGGGPGVLHPRRHPRLSNDSHPLTTPAGPSHALTSSEGSPQARKKDLAGAWLVPFVLTNGTRRERPYSRTPAWITTNDEISPGIVPCSDGLSRASRPPDDAPDPGDPG